MIESDIKWRLHPTLRLLYLCYTRTGCLHGPRRTDFSGVTTLSLLSHQSPQPPEPLSRDPLPLRGKSLNPDPPAQPHTPPNLRTPQQRGARGLARGPTNAKTTHARRPEDPQTPSGRRRRILRGTVAALPHRLSSHTCRKASRGARSTRNAFVPQRP